MTMFPLQTRRFPKMNMRFFFADLQNPLVKIIKRFRVEGKHICHHSSLDMGKILTNWTIFFLLNFWELFRISGSISKTYYGNTKLSFPLISKVTLSGRINNISIHFSKFSNFIYRYLNRSLFPFWIISFVRRAQLFGALFESCK